VNDEEVITFQKVELGFVGANPEKEQAVKHTIEAMMDWIMGQGFDVVLRSPLLAIRDKDFERGVDTTSISFRGGISKSDTKVGKKLNLEYYSPGEAFIITGFEK